MQGQDSLSKYSVIELDSIVAKLYQEDHYEQMIIYAQAAEKKAKEQFGGQDTLYARMLYNLGTAHDYAHDDVEKAMLYYNKAASIQKQKIPNSLDYIKTLIGIGDVYYFLLEDYEHAKQVYLQVVDLQLSLLGEEDGEYIISLNNLASTYTRLNKYEKAIAIFQKIVKIQYKIAGVDDLEYKISRLNLARMYTRAEYFKKAELIYVDVLKSLDKTNYNYPVSLNYLALVYESMGRIEEAEKLYLEIISFEKKISGARSLKYAVALNNYGIMLDGLGRYEEVNSLYLEVLSIQEEILGNNNLEYAVTLNNIASLCLSMKKYKEAKEYWLEAKNILYKLKGEDDLDYALILDNLAHLYLELKDYNLAKELAIKSKQIRLNLLGEGHSDYFSSINSLGIIYATVGEYKAAKNAFLESKKLQEERDEIKSISYAITLNSLASIHLSLKDYDEAISYIHLALKTSVEIPIGWEVNKDWVDNLANIEYNSDWHIANTIITLEHLYNYLGTQGTTEDKLYVIDLALKLLKKSRDGYVSSGTKMRSLKNSVVWLERGLNISSENRPREAFDFAEQGKSVLLQESINTNKAYAFGDLPDSLVQKEKELLKKSAELKARLIEKLPKKETDSLRSIFNNLAIELNNFKEKIESDYPKHAVLKYSSKTAKIEEIQHSLDAETAFLEYVVADSIVYLFYITKSSVELLKLPISKKVLKNRTQKLRSALSNYSLLSSKPKEAYNKYRVEAYWFYQNLVAIALEEQKNIKSLIIVTDGELGHLPFEAFLMEDAPQTLSSYSDLHYLMKAYNIGYNYSATLWKEVKGFKLGKNNHEILAVAADYGIKLDSNQFRRRLPVYQKLRAMLKPLPAAKKEVEGLSEKFYGKFVFGKEANEASFKEKAGSYGVIHLAMHGLLDMENPILSSLAFTENGDSLENNFLQAYEISKLELNADLVVLSACETGYGKFEQGNGIASLARAFMYAGVPSLVVSLWQVNDQATAMIMEKMYQNLAEGKMVTEALRQAKLEYLKNAKGIAAHPAFWSAFIQIGDSSAVQIKQKSENQKLWWFLGTGFLVLVVGVFILLKKRRKVDV